jgi:hypothetical protein
MYRKAVTFGSGRLLHERFGMTTIVNYHPQKQEANHDGRNASPPILRHNARA